MGLPVVKRTRVDVNVLFRPNASGAPPKPGVRWGNVGLLDWQSDPESCDHDLHGLRAGWRWAASRLVMEVLLVSGVATPANRSVGLALYAFTCRPSCCPGWPGRLLMGPAGVEGVSILGYPEEVEEERLAARRAQGQGSPAGGAGLGSVPGGGRRRQPRRFAAIRAAPNDRGHRPPPHARFGFRGWQHWPAVPPPGGRVPMTHPPFGTRSVRPRGSVAAGARRPQSPCASSVRNGRVLRSVRCGGRVSALRPIRRSRRSRPGLLSSGPWQAAQEECLLHVQQTFAPPPLGDLCPGQRVTRHRAPSPHTVERQATTKVKDQ